MKAILAALTLALAGAGTVAAQTAAPTGFTATYAVQARGMEAGEATYNFTFSPGRYEGTSSRRMTGIARAMLGASQDYDYSVRGAILPNSRFQPMIYRHEGGRRGRVVQARFTEDDIITRATPEMGMGNPPATQAQKRGAIDQVTMFAQLIFSPGADPCARTLNIYLDGRSRFDLVMSPARRERVNIAGYRGEAHVCSVQYRPIAGFGDPQEPATLTYVLGQSNGVYVPLRIEMPTDDAGVIRLQARTFTVR